MIYAKIIFIRRNGTDGAYYPLTSRTCLFGRHEECDIPIQLRQVADNHCQINVNEDGEILLTNLTGNSFSVSLNGSPLSNTARLRHMDVFCIRERSFRFEVLDPLQKNPSNTNRVSGTELAGANGQINTSDGNHSNEGARQPMVMENTEHRNIACEMQDSSVNGTDGNNVETGSATTILRRLNSSGLQMFHLRRIGPAATKPGVADVMDFWKVTSVIGRKATQIDFLIDSSDYIQGAYVSRLHARMVRRQNNIHRLFDDSLNGVYVNNFKIAGHVDMQEGDRVTFGHPQGSKLTAGIRVHQPDSEYQFMFEVCYCPPDSSPPRHLKHNVAGCQSQDAGTSLEVEMNEDISDQRQNSVFEHADKMQTESVKKDDSLETGHDDGSNEGQLTGFPGSRKEVDAMVCSVERMDEGEVEQNEVSFQANLGHQQEEAGSETVPSGSGLGSNGGHQADHTGLVTGVATLNGNSVGVIEQETVPNGNYVNQINPGISKQEECIVEDLSETDLEAESYGGLQTDNTGSKTEVYAPDVNEETVDEEAVVQNEVPRDQQNIGKDDVEEAQAKNLFDLNDIAIEHHQDTLISLEQWEPQQSADVVDTDVNVEQICKCTEKSVTEIEKKESNDIMTDVSMLEADFDDEFNEIAMKVKTELLAVSSQGEETNDADLGDNETSNAQDEMYFVDSQVENGQSISLHPNVDSSESMGIRAAGESGDIKTEALDKIEVTPKSIIRWDVSDTESGIPNEQQAAPSIIRTCTLHENDRDAYSVHLGYEIGLSKEMDMEVSGPVTQCTNDGHTSYVNSLDNKDSGEEKVFETGSVLLVEKISVKDPRQPYVDEKGKGSTHNGAVKKEICDTESATIIPATSVPATSVPAISFFTSDNRVICMRKPTSEDSIEVAVPSVDDKYTDLSGLSHCIKLDKEYGNMDDNLERPLLLKEDIRNIHLKHIEQSNQVERLPEVVRSTEKDIFVSGHATDKTLHKSTFSVDATGDEASNHKHHTSVTKEAMEMECVQIDANADEELREEGTYNQGSLNAESFDVKFTGDVFQTFDSTSKNEINDRDASTNNPLEGLVEIGVSDDYTELSGQRINGEIDQKQPKLKVSSGEGISLNLQNETGYQPSHAGEQGELIQETSLQELNNAKTQQNTESIDLKMNVDGLMNNVLKSVENAEMNNNSVSVDAEEMYQKVAFHEKESDREISDLGEQLNREVASSEKGSDKKNVVDEEVLSGEKECAKAASNPEDIRDQIVASFKMDFATDVSELQDDIGKVIACFEKEFVTEVSNTGQQDEDIAMSDKSHQKILVNQKATNQEDTSCELKVLSDLGKDRNKAFSCFGKESFEVISNPKEDNYKDVASFEEESSEVISHLEEELDQENAFFDNVSIKVISDFELNKEVGPSKRESAKEISNSKEDNTKELGDFKQKSGEDQSPSEEEAVEETSAMEMKDLYGEGGNKDEFAKEPLDCNKDIFKQVACSEKEEEIDCYVKEISEPRKKVDQMIAHLGKDTAHDILGHKEEIFKESTSSKWSTEVQLNTEEEMDDEIVHFKKELDKTSLNTDEVSFFQSKSYRAIATSKEEICNDIASFSKNSKEKSSTCKELVHIQMASPQKRSENERPGHEDKMEEENASFDRKSSVVIAPEEEMSKMIASLDKHLTEAISDSEEDYMEVFSVEKKSDSVTTNPTEQMEQLDAGNEKEDAKEMSFPEQVNGKEVFFREKERVEVILNPEQEIVKEVTSFRNEFAEQTSCTGEENKQKVAFSEKEITEESRHHGTNDSRVVSFCKDCAEVMSDLEEKLHQKDAFYERESDTEKERETSLEEDINNVVSLGNCSATEKSNHGESNKVVTLFEKDSTKSPSPREKNIKEITLFKMESAQRKCLNEDRKEEGSDAGHLNDKNPDKMGSDSLSHEKADEIYTAVCQDEARTSQPVSQLETKHKMEISKDDLVFFDKSNSGDDREDTFQQGCSQDLFENLSQWNVSRVGCTDIIHGIASADLKSIENVESASKSGRKRKLSEILQENDDSNEVNGDCPKGLPLKKISLPTENEHSRKSCSKDEVIKDESEVFMDCREMESVLEHKTVETKVYVKNDTVDDYVCAISSIQNTDSTKQQFLPENGREIENNHTKKYFSGEDQSVVPIDCGGKISELEDNGARDTGTACIKEIIEDSGSSMSYTSKTESSEQECLTENDMEAEEEFAYGNKVSSKEISYTENHGRVQDCTCNVAMNDGDSDVEPHTDEFRILSSIGEVQIIDLDGLSNKEFNGGTVTIISDEEDKDAESSDPASDKDSESSELDSDKDAESSKRVMDKDAESSELVMDKPVESSELVMDKDAESSELVMDKDAESSELVMDKDAESSELVMDKDAESSELVMDKDVESSELVMDKDVESSELVMDKDAVSSELVMDKDVESSELVMDKDAVSLELVMDKAVKSSELVMDKDVESSELVMDKDVESSESAMDKAVKSSEHVMDKDFESSELVMDKAVESSELVMDKEAESSEFVMDKEAESLELVMDKDVKSSELVMDKAVKSSELVMDKDVESSELVMDKAVESSELALDKDVESSELVMDKDAVSSELVMDKDVESSESAMDKAVKSSEHVMDKDFESSELVMDKAVESSELVMDKEAESSELVMDKEAESSGLVMDKDVKSSELVMDKAVKSSELVMDKDVESSELVMDKAVESSELALDKDVESSELVMDKDAESSQLVMDKDVESSELCMDKDVESSELVMDKDAESSELVMDKDAESSELVMDKDAEFSEPAMDKDVESSDLVMDKDRKSSERDNVKGGKPSELVMHKGAESSEPVMDKAVESSELVMDKDAESSEPAMDKDVESSELVMDIAVETSELVMDKAVESSELGMNKDAESSEPAMDKDVESSELVMDKAVESSELVMDKAVESSELVMDKDAESSEHVMDKAVESSELVIDKDVESSELAMDKDIESSELVRYKAVEFSELVRDKDAESSEPAMDKDVESSDLVMDKDRKSSELDSVKGGKPSELVMDKDAESSEPAMDKAVESSELVMDKDAESSEPAMDKDAESSEYVMDKAVESSELVMDKDAESSELVMDKDAESSELVMDKDVKSSELVIDKEAESSELVMDKDVESSELVIDKDAESSELVMDKDAESSELVIDKDAESSELVMDKEAESSEHVMDKDVVSSELVRYKAVEFSELVMDKDAESSELVMDKDVGSSELVMDKDAKSSESAMDKDVESSELVMDKDSESSELDSVKGGKPSELVMDKDAESSELGMDKDAESLELVRVKAVELSELVMDKDAESSELVMDKDVESLELAMDKDAESSQLVMDKAVESSDFVINEEAESELVMDKNAESSELVMDKDAESSELVTDKDVESSKIAGDKGAELSDLVRCNNSLSSEYVNSGSVDKEDLGMKRSCRKGKNSESLYYLLDEETTSNIKPCDQSEGSNQMNDGLHTELTMQPDLDADNEKAGKKRGCREEIIRDVDEVFSVQSDIRDKQGEIMQLTDKSCVLNVKKMRQLSEKGKKSETKAKEFVPCVEGQGEDLKPCSSPESEPLVSLGSDDWDANSDVALDTTENDTDSTLNDSTIKCLPLLSVQVSNENGVSINQVKETPRCFAWPSPNHLDDVSRQLAMSPVIPQQTSIISKSLTADQDECLFSDHSDDDDNGISSLKISALVDDLQKTPIVDEAESLLEKTLHFSGNLVSSPLKCQKEAVSRSPRSDDGDHFNLDFSDVVDDVTCDDDDDDDDDEERPVVERYRDGIGDNVSNVNQSNEQNVEDEGYVNENEEEHSSGSYSGNIQYLDMEDNENVDQIFHGIISNDDNNIENVHEEGGQGIMPTRRKRSSSLGKRKMKNTVSEIESLHKKVRQSFTRPLDSSPIAGQKSEYIYQRHNQLDFELHDQGQNSSYPDQSELISTQAVLSSQSVRSPSKFTSVSRQLEYKVQGKSRYQTVMEKLTRLKPTKDSNEEAKASSSLASSSSSQETPSEMSLNNSQHDHFPSEGDPENVTTLVTRCKSIMEKMRQVLNLKTDVLPTHRVQALNEELGKAEKWSELPQTVIAMVGNTGDGKSSLMNAMLGHSSILPTSGIRACTAVVVEVVQNNGSMYEGCIEFLTKEEWYSELKRLIEDLTLSNGNLRTKPPEPGSDQYVSYCKVKAVYGKIDKYEVLARINKVTSRLGQKQIVKHKKAREFRLAVERFIETQEPQSGGQFWPIVKHVQLRLPNCDVCRTGAALIDLPGVRDSNAARDKIARDYLKNCSAIWVVSAMHRAIDDKTAQDLLSENLRRQLLMDGHYGSVAFICTKSDQFEISETIRTLKLQDKCGDHKQQISLMDREKQSLLEDIKICKVKKRDLNAEIKTSIKECEALQLLVQEIEAQLMDSDLEQPVDHEPMEEAKVMLKEKEKEREKNKETVEEITQDIQRCERQVQDLENQIRLRRRKISHICASARNDYCREKIKQKFQSGLKEIKRQANRLPDEDEDEVEDEDEDAEEVSRMVSNLRVFCCSSTEYQKMKDLIPTDGEAIVFNSQEETEIPQLQEYVHEITRVRHERYLERLIRGLGHCIFNFQSYILDGGTECGDTRTRVKLVIEKNLQDFNSMIQTVLDKLAEDLDNTFNDMIQPKFHEGVGQAAQEATGICQKWGSQQSTDHANRRAGGLHWATYKATIQRLGVYSSGTFGNIDFNEELSEPFNRSITVVWNKVFSSILWRILETVQEGVLEKIQHLSRNVSSELQKIGVHANRIDHVKEQLVSNVNYKLTEMVSHLKPLVTAKQRDINRILSPHVQSRLVEAYISASSQTGKGCFARMKQEMESGIDGRRMYIFDDGSQKMMHELLNLKTEMVNAVSAVCDMLQEEIKLAYEPLWEDPSQSVLLQDTFQQDMEEVCEEMRKIYRDAGLQNTEEQAQSQKKSLPIQHPPKRPQERKSVCDIVQMWITQVPEELTKMTDLEVLKVERGSNMYPVKAVKLKPGLSSDSGMHNPSDVASSSGMDGTRVKMEVLSGSSDSLNQYNSERPVPPFPTAGPSYVPPFPTAGPSSYLTNPPFSSMAGQLDVYYFGEASMTNNSQHGQTRTKVTARAKQTQNSKASKNVPPEVRIALENHMVKRSTETSSKHEHAAVSSIVKQKIGNSSTTTTLKQEAHNSSRGSSGIMVSLLKSIPGTSSAQVNSSKEPLQVNQKGTSSLDARISLLDIRRTSSASLVGDSASREVETISDKIGTTSAGKMVKRSTETSSKHEHADVSSIVKQKIGNSSTATTLKQEAHNSSRLVSGIMVSLLKSVPGTSTAQVNSSKEPLQVNQKGTSSLDARISFLDSLVGDSASREVETISDKIGTTSTGKMGTVSSGIFKSSSSGNSTGKTMPPLADNTGSTSADRTLTSSADKKTGPSSAGKTGTSSVGKTVTSASSNGTSLTSNTRTSSASYNKPLSASNTGFSPAGKVSITSKEITRTSSSSTMGTYSLERIGTTSRGIEGNSSDVKGNPSSGVKRTSTSEKTGITASVSKDNDILPEISFVKRRKITPHKNLQDNPTFGHGTDKVSQGKWTEMSQMIKREPREVDILSRQQQSTHCKTNYNDIIDLTGSDDE